MKKVLSLILVMALSLSLIACGSAGAEETEAPQAAGLQVGFGRQNITPDYTVHLQGGDWKNRVGSDVLDYLYITCIALSEGDETVLLYTVDMKVATDNIVDPVKLAINAATGIPQDRILLNATHTHSSVAIRYNWDGVEKYKTEFSNAAVAAAQQALADLSAAEVYAGSTQATGMAHVRHYLMNDGTYSGSNFGDTSSGYKEHAKEADNELQIVKFDRGADKKPVILTSFPAHCTFNESGVSLSADYPGPYRDYVERETGSLMAFFQGASGDQTPGSRIPGVKFTDDYRTYGKELGRYTVEALPTLAKVEGTGVAVSTKNFTAPTNMKNMDKLVGAQKAKKVAEEHGNNSEELKAVLKEFNLASRHEANWLVIRANAGPTQTMELKTMVVGGLSFVLAPYEMFGGQGAAIKEQSPYDNTFIITLGEGSFNYIASTESFDYDCYESQCCYFEQGTAEKLVDEFVGMLAEMKSPAA